MKIKSKLALACVLMAASKVSHAGLISINVNHTGGLSESQVSIFDSAKDLWGSVLTGIQSSFDLTLNIAASGADIDGRNGTLGQAGPTRAIIDSDLGFVYASEGRMQFDTADLNYMENNNTLFDVIVHEMAHVLGFGTLWDPASLSNVFAGTQSVYVDGSGQYTGAFALAEYRAEFDPDALFIPVELDGGGGTVDAHWDEFWDGGSSDLMTGYLEGVTSLSRTTIASFADIGYTTIVTHPIETDSINVPEPATITLFGAGLIGVAGLRRRRNKS